jgi:putative ATP-dependent endonuclease of OLD family
MQIKCVTISNFRSIKHVEMELGATTVLIGPNNAGKTAILEAIRIALTRRWGQRGTGFTEYDVHLSASRPDPKVGDPVTIDVEMQESVPSEWPLELHETLADIIQVNPVSGQASILMRVSCSWDAGEESYVPKWEFLNVDRLPLTGKGARATNLQEFFPFLPVFYLAALRDAGEEFAAKGQFWGRLLRTAQIPDALEQKSARVFNLLNKKFLTADPMLGDLAASLSDIGRVATTGTNAQANLRILPLNTWDLLSKAEVIYQTDGAKPWLPLVRHGQGVQSLSVMFLFRTFVELLLEELYRAESTPVLAMEEPETHLHPQAARSLFQHISKLPGQKIVSTHSPYFLQHIPFRDLRVVRAGADGTVVRSLPREFRCRIPNLTTLTPIIAGSGGILEYDSGLSELVIKGELPTTVYQSLLIAYHGQAQTLEYHSKLRAARDASLEYVTDDELNKLETFARRIRGEIFFANKWLLVEGQSEYHILHGMAKAIGYDFDENGVSVIDFQNNGNPACFAVLARALGYPWVIVVDGDTEGQRFLADVSQRNFDATQMAKLSRRLPAGFLEQQLVADGLQQELKDILSAQGVANTAIMNDTDLIVALKKEKCGYAAELAVRCAASAVLTQRMPLAFRESIQTLRTLP